MKKKPKISIQCVKMWNPNVHLNMGMSAAFISQTKINKY